METLCQLQRLNSETAKWEFVRWTRNKNCPCCSTYERVV